MKRLAKKVLPRFVFRLLHNVRQQLETIRYRRMIRSFPRRVAEHDYGGMRLKVILGDPEGLTWYDRDWPPLPELELLSRGRLRNGARVFNIGAHQGLIAMMLSRKVWPKGHVVAVDPHAVNTEIIFENCALNGIDNISAVQAAAAAKPGKLLFGSYLNDRVGAPNGGSIVVRAVSIDELATEYGRPDVAFVDVEGFECEVLAGAAAVFASGRTDWFVEVHVGVGLEGFGRTADDVLVIFPAERYERFVASETEREFVHLAEGRHLLHKRFFLVALDKEPAANSLA